MDLFWKQFAGSDTGLSSNVFFKARLKLTLLYIIIVAIIVFGFSGFLYRSIGQNLKDAHDDEFAGVESHRHFVENTLVYVKDDLILADLVILILTAGLSFILAGKTLKPIQLSVEAQRVFAANASHELRTPLAVMRNDIEVFMRGTSSIGETSRTMNSNLEEIERMSGIVENLLMLARSDNASLPTLSKLDVSALSKTMVQKMQSQAHKKNIKLILKSSEPLMIRGDSALLERAMLNILQNSIEHTPPGGSITVETVKKDAEIAISIVDTGSGIHQKDLPHIFTRFYKTESSGGSGLGLSIVKEIVEQHDGSISVESVHGKGTTVTVRFSII